MDGQWADITGMIALLPGLENDEQLVANAVWVAAFAYDEQNKIVGVRKWVANDALQSGNWVKFDLTVSSLGLPIHHVEILTETRQ